MGFGTGPGRQLEQEVWKKAAESSTMWQQSVARGSGARRSADIRHLLAPFNCANLVMPLTLTLSCHIHLFVHIS